MERKSYGNARLRRLLWDHLEIRPCSGEIFSRAALVHNSMQSTIQDLLLIALPRECFLHALHQADCCCYLSATQTFLLKERRSEERIACCARHGQIHLALRKTFLQKQQIAPGYASRSRTTRARFNLERVSPCSGFRLALLFVCSSASLQTEFHETIQVSFGSLTQTCSISRWNIGIEAL
eukprot:2821462-Rhodomonas_salina.2